jgi:endonuclease YncB( thermonuclease family)
VDCLTCGEAVQVTRRAGRQPNYCRPQCRTEHRTEMKRRERFVLSLESALDMNRRMLSNGWRPEFYGPTVKHYETQVAEARAALEALRRGVWS